MTLSFNPLKEIRNAVKSIDKAGKKFESEANKALLGKKLGGKVTKAMHSKEGQQIKKIAGMAVATYFGGPVAGKAVGAAFAKMGAANMGAAIAAKGAAMGSGSLTAKIATGLAKEGVTQLASKEIKRRLEKKVSQADAAQINAAKNAVFNALEITADQVTELTKDPQFNAKFESMIREGKTLAEIERAWAASPKFRETVMNNVPEIIKPLIYETLVEQGLPHDKAARTAQVEAERITEQEVNALTLETVVHEYGPLIAIATPIALALLF